MRFFYVALMPRPFLGSLLTAGGAIAGALIGRKGQKESNVANAQQALQQMDFQERMSTSAHQREVADLRAAGLNPILSGTGGAGATSPGGAMARIENVDEHTAASAHQAATAIESLKNLRESNKQIRADTTLKTQDSWRSSATTEREKQEAFLIEQRTKTERENTRAAKETADILTSDAKGRSLEGQIDETKYGEVMRYINRAIRSITGGSSAIQNLRQ